MNATIGNPRTRNLEVVHGHLLVVALGVIVLGVLLSVGGGLAFGGGTAGTPSPSPFVAHRASPPADIPMRIYIVADEAQREKILVSEDEAALTRYAAGDMEPVTAVDVIVAGTQLNQALLDIAAANGIRAQQGLEPIQVVDLR